MTGETAPSRPRIAAVVVNYNYERFVATAIQSVLDQSVPFDEILVVDDGSTDDSASVLRGFGDRVRLIEKQNGGPLSAAWAALAETACDYIYVLDADDSADSDLVARVAPILTSRPVKIQFQLRSMAIDGSPIDSVFPSYRDGYSSREMRADNELLGFYVCAPTSGNLFRADYLNRLRGMNLDEREAYDGVPAQLAPYFGDVVSLNVPLARYRVHETSLSSWSAPTPALMQRELQRFENRWSEVIRVLHEQGVPQPDPARSAFVSERELMERTLLGRRPPLRTAFRHARSLLRSHRSLPQRIVFSTWGFGLVVLPRKTAAHLVYAKRAVGRRGRLTSTVARLARAKSPAGVR